MLAPLLTIHCWRLLFIYAALKLFTGFAIAAFIDFFNIIVVQQ
jgi:hypothetical protein